MKTNYTFASRLFVVFLVLISNILQAQNLKGQNQLIPNIDKYRLIIKINKDYIVDFEAKKPLLKNVNAKLAQTLATNTLQKLKFSQVFDYSTVERKSLRTNSASLRSKKQFNKYDFVGLAYIDSAEFLPKEKVIELANNLESLPYVEYVALEPVTTILPPTVTPDFTLYQYYQKDTVSVKDNIIGINIEYAWSKGIAGQGVKIADIEWGFNYNHEDLVSENFIELVRTTNFSSDDHGTAVAGIMYAKKNNYGMTGNVHAADKFYGISEIPFGRVYGISKGLEVLSEGDVFVYEMQATGPTGAYIPADYNQAVWDITKSATEAGIVVVAAAGNGAQNLDLFPFKAYLDRGDNGSIIVGASTKVGRNRADFSTYGSRVNLQGWGDYSVAATGYGALYNGGPNATYTSGFSGTSAATPIVASAVVAVQSYAKNKLGRILSPIEIRNLLVQTGTPQGTGGNVGPLPNVKRAIELMDIWNLVPIVSITSPNSNLVFDDTSAITISANAVDNDGTVKKVEFYANNVLVGADSIFPYSIVWNNNYIYGNVKLVAKAYDNLGGVNKSTAINVVINSVLNFKPSVKITSPTLNQLFDNLLNISFTVNASDKDGQIIFVKYFVNGNLVSTVKTAPFSFNYNETTPDKYVLKAIAYDNDSTFNADSTTYYIRKKVFSSNCGAAIWEANKQYCANELVAYNNKVYKSSWCGSGEIPGSNQWGSWKFQNDCQGDIYTILPTITIINPIENQVFTEIDTVQISTNANDVDGSIAKVSFYVDEILVGENTKSPFDFKVANLTVGKHKIKVIATDNNGGVSKATIVTIEVVGELTAIENSTKTNLNLYPNPTSGIIQISQNVDNVEVYNVLGNKELSVSNVNTIDLSNLENGVYLVKIANTVYKVIKE
ncbi:MAG: hypothetical protein RLZZ175_2154 [Bacteroidota bacterium]|jgi:hypothetical protein